jgi:hypothetical protein
MLGFKEYLEEAAVAEQLDELSNNTLTSYIGKASTSIKRKTHDANVSHGRENRSTKEYQRKRWASDKDKNIDSATRRAGNIHKAALKLIKMKEEADLDEAAVDAKGFKSSTGGLTQKGRDHYNRTEGGNLKAPVTTPPSKLKPGSKAANRRKSFCARMSGVDGPMKKPNGEPTRKALALRKWNC